MKINDKEQYFINEEPKKEIQYTEKEKAEAQTFLVSSICNILKIICLIILAPFAIIIFAIVGAASETSKNNRRGRRR